MCFGSMPIAGLCGIIGAGAIGVDVAAGGKFGGGIDGGGGIAGGAAPAGGIGKLGRLIGGAPEASSAACFIGIVVGGSGSMALTC